MRRRSSGTPTSQRYRNVRSLSLSFELSLLNELTQRFARSRGRVHDPDRARVLRRPPDPHLRGASPSLGEPLVLGRRSCFRHACRTRRRAGARCSSTSPTRKRSCAPGPPLPLPGAADPDARSLSPQRKRQDARAPAPRPRAGRDARLGLVLVARAGRLPQRRPGRPPPARPQLSRRTRQQKPAHAQRRHDAWRRATIVLVLLVVVAVALGRTSRSRLSIARRRRLAHSTALCAPPDRLAHRGEPVELGGGARHGEARRRHGGRGGARRRLWRRQGVREELESASLALSRLARVRRVPFRRP